MHSPSSLVRRRIGPRDDPGGHGGVRLDPRRQPHPWRWRAGLGAASRGRRRGHLRGNTRARRVRVVAGARLAAPRPHDPQPRALNVEVAVERLARPLCVCPSLERHVRAQLVRVYHKVAQLAVGQHVGHQVALGHGGRHATNEERRDCLVLGRLLLREPPLPQPLLLLRRQRRLAAWADDWAGIERSEGAQLFDIVAQRAIRVKSRSAPLVLLLLSLVRPPELLVDG
mmetsp:Transcript_10774/g.21867  ORF Transcript_10774/g.21867 Transcript_10774/m.21867 type:complete len:227 (-) Transcript_10774:392-1072(-)